MSININLDRNLAFKYLRFILLMIVLAFCLKPTIKHLEDFDKSIIPLAKNHFQFVQPLTVRGESDISDFTTFYASGLLNKERLTKFANIDVYDPILLTQAVAHVIAPMRPVEVYSIQYPPIFFALTTPLAYLDIYTAWRIWFFVSAICIIISFFCVAYRVLKDKLFLLISLIVCFINAPAMINFSLGQTTAFECAILAVSLSLLMNKKYFAAGLVAALSFLKLQQTLIILIPGIIIGRGKFFYGCLLMLIFEGIVSSVIVGPNNMFNFIQANYLCEMTHAYVGLNETWAMSNFRSLLYSLSNDCSRANTIAILSYIFSCLVSCWLWIKVYPSLQKISGQAFELVASVSIIILMYFSLHGYLYDFMLLSMPALWLYIWSGINDAGYTTGQTIVRLLISVAAFTLPFVFWPSVDLMLSENTNVLYQLRIFGSVLILLFLAMAALFIEWRQGKHKTVSA